MCWTKVLMAATLRINILFSGQHVEFIEKEVTPKTLSLWQVWSQRKLLLNSLLIWRQHSQHPQVRARSIKWRIVARLWMHIYLKAKTQKVPRGSIKKNCMPLLHLSDALRVAEHAIPGLLYVTPRPRSADDQTSERGWESVTFLPRENCFGCK